MVERRIMSKKSKKKNKDDKVEPLIYETTGDTVTPSVAYNQAVSLLDIAAIVAVESSDTEGMATVANNWMQLAALLSGIGRSDDDAQEGSIVTTGRIPGFRDELSRGEVEDGIRKGKS
jgi:hypothetical protein